MKRMPGGGRRFTEQAVQMAMLFIVILLLVFFALVIRGAFDKDPASKDAIMAVLKKRGVR